MIDFFDIRNGILTMNMIFIIIYTLHLIRYDNADFNRNDAIDMLPRLLRTALLRFAKPNSSKILRNPALSKRCLLIPTFIRSCCREMLNQTCNNDIIFGTNFNLDPTIIDIGVPLS